MYDNFHRHSKILRFYSFQNGEYLVYSLWKGKSTSVYSTWYFDKDVEDIWTRTLKPYLLLLIQLPRLYVEVQMNVWYIC